MKRPLIVLLLVLLFAAVTVAQCFAATGIGKRTVEGEPLFVQGGGWWGGQEIADPGTPPSGEWWFYVDSTSHAVVMESNGTENVIAGLSAPIGVTEGGTGLATIADTGIPFADAADSLAVDATNFSFADATNTFALGGGATDGGEIRLKEDSDNGTNYFGFQAPASLASSFVVTPWDAALVAGDLMVADGANDLGVLAKSTRTGVAVRNTGASNVPGYGPVQTVLLQLITPPLAHTGLTGAETTLTPIADEGSPTIAAADFLAGACFPFTAALVVAGDADGDETLTLNLYLDAHLLGTSGAIADDGATTVFINGSVKVLAVGAGGTATASGLIVNGTTVVPFSNDFSGNFDTTDPKDFLLKADWGGTTDADDSVVLSDQYLAINNFD